jgi:hypothetical protein
VVWGGYEEDFPVICADVIFSPWDSRPI